MNIRAISDNNSLFQACKNSVVQDYYSLPVFQEWKQVTGNFVTRIVEYYKGELLLHDANPSKLQGRSAGTNTRTSATPCTTRSAGTRTPTSATPSITRRV
jgi:hypothetical protein